jgi:hypothetical protein
MSSNFSKTINNGFSGGIPADIVAETILITKSSNVQDIKVSDLSFKTSNISIGTDNLDKLTTGLNNIAVGESSQKECTSGANNISIGANSCKNNQENGSNIGIGANALMNNIGHSNVVVGDDSLKFNVYGAENTIIGCDIGRGSENLNRCVIIGARSYYSINQVTNFISIGAFLQPTNPQSNTVLIGNDLITTTTIAGDIITTKNVNCKNIVTTDSSNNTIISNQVYTSASNNVILGNQTNNAASYTNVLCLGQNSMSCGDANNQIVLGDTSKTTTKIYGDIYPQNHINLNSNGITFQDNTTLKSSRFLKAAQNLNLSGVSLNNGTQLTDLPSRVNQSTYIWMDSNIRQTNPTTNMASYTIRLELTMSIVDDQYPSGSLASTNFLNGYELVDLIVNFTSQVIFVNPITYTRNLLAYTTFRSGGFTPFTFSYYDRNRIQINVNLPTQANTTTQRLSSYLLTARIVSSSNCRNSTLYLSDMNSDPSSTFSGTAYFGDTYITF